ncbi:MAG: diaminopimelate epimerase [Rickettsiales bacterium]|nr:diaminopimelate epimerase [Rickettsiales bacterium]
MNIPFVKMHGNGNDFIIIDNDKLKIKQDKKLIKKMSDRRLGIGCDQLILMEKSKSSDVFMRIFNANGLEAEMCGNAARCVAALIFAGQRKKTVKIETISNTVIGKLEKNNEISINLKLPTQDLTKIIKKEYGETINLEHINPFLKKGYVINMGNPHIVFFIKNLKLINLEKIGNDIGKFKAFKNGINVEIVELISNKAIKIKFWERGVGHTPSCGSGILAAFYAAYLKKKCLASAKVLLPNGTVTASFEKDVLCITGNAEVSFLGEYNHA